MSDAAKEGLAGRTGSETVSPMITIDSSFHDGPARFESVLQALDMARIMRVTRMDDLNVEMREMCDEFYSVRLTPQQLRLLAAELVAIADAMSPNAHRERPDEGGQR